MEESSNSMLYWYPKVKDLVPTPKTIMVPVKTDEPFYDLLDGNPLPPNLEKELKKAANKIGYPLFMRSDVFSGKHDWQYTCYVPKEEALTSHLRSLADSQFALWGMEAIKAIVFREYIPMDFKFLAFYGSMPVNSERRYFIKDGKIICRHPYWVKDAIIRPSSPRWEEYLKEMNTETLQEIDELTHYANLMAGVLDGFWSLDFCRAATGKWFFIDAAIGERSWHPEDCPNCPEEVKPRKPTKDKVLDINDIIVVADKSVKLANPNRENGKNEI
jgi:hypothetical protein